MRATREFEQTALMMAVREGYPEAVALLLERGADVDAHTRIGPTPDFIPPCKRTGCFSEGAGINRGGIPDRGWRPPARGGLTPLLYAARDGRAAEAAQLLAAGADVELAEANGIRPLLMALLTNQLGVVHLLLKHGADVNADDFWGRTPLFAAVEYRNRDLRNRDLSRRRRSTARRCSTMIALLIERGANVNARTREWPYSRTSFTSDLSWVDVTGQTPFLRAALAGDTTTMRLLLAHGADPNIATFEGTTPLMAASGVNWTVAQTYTESPQALLDAIQICLDHGADVNAVNSMGVTAMIGAANRGSNDIIRFLHAKGARLDVVDKQGRSPLRWAEGVFLATTRCREQAGNDRAAAGAPRRRERGGPLAMPRVALFGVGIGGSRGGGRGRVCVPPTPHAERERRRAVGDARPLLRGLPQRCRARRRSRLRSARPEPHARGRGCLGNRDP